MAAFQTELHATGSYLSAVLDLPLRLFIDVINSSIPKSGKRSCTFGFTRGAEDPAGHDVLPDGCIYATIGTVRLPVVRVALVCFY